MGTNYYLRLEACDHCGRGIADIHLGKASMGWAFLFRAYPDDVYAGYELTQAVTDFASWSKLLDLGPVFDEYGRRVSRDDFLALIDARRGRHQQLYGSDYSDADGNVFCPQEFS